MSIYLFKTEDFYGGETRIFTDKVMATEYLNAFIERTESKIDAVIEEHKAVIPENHKVFINIVRNDGWWDTDLKVSTWTPVNSIF